MLLIEHLGGAVARVGRDETAFNHRDCEYNLAIICALDRARTQADGQHRLDAGGLRGDAPYARGVYVNYLGVGEQADRVRAAYGEEKYARLVELKNRYDPRNRFCFNQNIKPTG